MSGEPVLTMPLQRLRKGWSDAARAAAIAARRAQSLGQDPKEAAAAAKEAVAGGASVSDAVKQAAPHPQQEMKLTGQNLPPIVTGKGSVAASKVAYEKYREALDAHGPGGHSHPDVQPVADHFRKQQNEAYAYKEERKAGNKMAETLPPPARRRPLDPTKPTPHSHTKTLTDDQLVAEVAKHGERAPAATEIRKREKRVAEDEAASHDSNADAINKDIRDQWDKIKHSPIRGNPEYAIMMRTLTTKYKMSSAGARRYVARHGLTDMMFSG